MVESKTETNKTEVDNRITYLERNGRTFAIISHFSDGQTYSDIVKNALRRESEHDCKTAE